MVFTDRLTRILPALVMAVALSTYAQDDLVTRDDAKKSLTHAMLQNTTWQNEDAIDALVVGLYGQDKELERVLRDYMPTIEVRGKPVVVRTYQSLPAAREANVLLLARSENARLDEINDALRLSQTLIVADGFDDREKIMANFSHPARRRVSFEINARNIIDAGLELSSDILMFAGSKRDLADYYQYNATKLEQATTVASEQQRRLDEQQQLLYQQQQRLDEQQQRLDEQQQRLDERGGLQDQSAMIETQRAELESTQRKLASMEGQLLSIQQTLAESETQRDQYAAELEDMEKVLAEKEADLKRYPEEIARSPERLDTEEQPVRTPARTLPEQGPVLASQPGVMQNQRFILSATAGALLSILVLIGLLIHANRSKRRLAEELEGKTLKLVAARERLLQVTEAESRCILEQAKLLEATDLNNQQSTYVSVISKSADELLGLTSGISELSRVEAGRLELEATPFSLRDVLGDILQPLALRASEKGLELTFHIPPGIPDKLIGDPLRLRQVMDNLVGNAIKFTDSGEVSVDVQLESGTDAAVRVRFEVRDTGIGIAPEQQDKIFEPFASDDSSASGDAGGTGLGLAMSDQLAQLLGSGLSVRSKPGEGSSFHFSADFQLPDGPAPAAVKPLRALVVDDNETNRMILEELLDSWGMAVTVADGGESALEELTRAEQAGDSFALALLDVVMPEMDGFELAAKIRERPTQRAVRILMLASAGQTEVKDLQRRLDISCVLHKPTKHSDLLAAITDALGISGEAVTESAQGGAVTADSSKVMPMGNIAAKRRVATEMLGKLRPQAPLETDDDEAVEHLAADVRGDQEEAEELEELDEAEATELQPDSEDGQPCLDWSGALRNLEGDEDFLVELADKFLVEYPRMLAWIEDAVSKDDGDELRLAANALKGESQLVGAITVTEAASKLENLGHIGEISSASAMLHDLRNDLEVLEKALVNELSEREASEKVTQSHQV